MNGTFIINQKKASGDAPHITIADLIPEGMENAISRQYLLDLCILNNLCTTDRAMRSLIQQARIDYVILNREEGGYYRPTLEDVQDLQRYIKQEESRAKKIHTSIKRARALYEDYMRGRIANE